MRNLISFFRPQYDSEKRIIDIDCAKGILIILMVIAHVFQYGVVHDIVYSFHMAAFFVISGILMNYSKWTAENVKLSDIIKATPHNRRTKGSVSLALPTFQSLCVENLCVPFAGHQ